jgi:hypothetical protein
MKNTHKAIKELQKYRYFVKISILRLFQWWVPMSINTFVAYSYGNYFATSLICYSICGALRFRTHVTYFFVW